MFIPACGLITSRSLHDENDLLLPLHLLQPTVTLPLIEQSLEVLSTNIKIYASTDSYFKWINLVFLFDFMQNNRRRSDSISQNSDSSNSSELDLELTLSLWVKCYGKVGSKCMPNS